MRWFHAARARLGLLSRRAAESRIDQEIGFHIDMETERLVREQHMTQDEARRRALVTFGGVQQHRETLREGRGTAWLSGMSLDLKLGGRMLMKYPGLTLIGGAAMAFGIWFGAVTFHMFGILSTTTLPLPHGDRIVHIKNWDLKLRKDEDPVLFDYQLYRGLRSITDLGAYRNVSPNVVGSDGSAQPAVGAEVTASAFRIAPDRPLHGRVIEASDERAGAPPVVVLGYELWRTRFAGNPQVVGRSVQLGNNFATVVGVMPEGYAFPVSHELWMPLRTDVPSVEPRSGVDITIFGRLAPGMSLGSAEAEVRSIAKGVAAEHPATHAQLQPHVLPYTQQSVNGGGMQETQVLIYFFIVVLVAVVCSTVALLLFARAASRESEILVRSALGASRGRIMVQLFAEALVLAGVAAVVGLVMAQVALTNLGRPYLEMNYGRLPFWYDFDLAPATIVWALLLALIAALITGVIPARKITHGLGARLRAGTAGGGGVSFGGVWTAVIVVQVALTVAFPGAVMFVHGEMKRMEGYDIGFRGQEYLGMELGIDGPPKETLDSAATAALAARFGASMETLRRRLEAEPGIAAVTIVDRLPADYHAERVVDVASMPGASPAEASLAWIDPLYFEALQAPLRAGRAFTNADLSPDARVVIVDQAFADLVMPGRNPVGQRVRMRLQRTLDSASARLPWYEVIGVAKDLGMSHPARSRRTPGVYLPFIPGSRTAMGMIVRGKGDPLTVAPRIRELATAVDPSLRMDAMLRFDKATTDFVWFLALWVRIMVGLTAVALVLSLSGIYSVLAYTVARRTREIGVRVALGASERRVIASIFRRPLTQVAAGVLAGTVLLALAALFVMQQSEMGGTGRGLTVGEIAALIGYAILMLGVCLLACVVPTMRALRVQPTEALRAE